MSEIVFQSENQTIYDPLKVTNALQTVTVVNYSEESESTLGVYIAVASGLGDINFPADYPPATDYQDILTWGQASTAGGSDQGGLYLEVEQDSGTWTGYVNHNQGSTYRNKIPVKTLLSGETLELKLRVTSPIGNPARRLFIDIRVE